MPRLTQGFFLAGAPRAQTLAGTMFPQPLVERDGKPVRLDDVLGAGFAVLSYGAEPDALARQARTLAEKLQANVVGCLPRSMAFAAKPLAVMVRDQSGEIGALLQERPTLVVLRPDRYVAAVFTAGDIKDGVAAVEQMIAQTFARMEARSGEAVAV
jgi:3-(3-hydroxy-phenyl)propionate hydroxylase